MNASTCVMKLAVQAGLSICSESVLARQTQIPFGFHLYSLLKDQRVQSISINNCLIKLASRLAQHNKKKKLKELGRNLTWPFRKEEIKSLLSALERQKSLFNLALQNDSLCVSQM